MTGGGKLRYIAVITCFCVSRESYCDCLTLRFVAAIVLYLYVQVQGNICAVLLEAVGVRARILLRDLSGQTPMLLLLRFLL